MSNINFIPINIEGNQKWFEIIKKKFEQVFNYVQQMNICVWFDFPSLDLDLGEIKFMFFIEIPRLEGNYYRVNLGGNDSCYVTTLAFGIRGYRSNYICEVDDTKYVCEDGSFYEYKTSLKGAGWRMKDVLKTSRNIPLFDWLVAPNLTKYKNLADDFVILSNNLENINFNKVVRSAVIRTCGENNKYKKILSFNINDRSFEEYIKSLNERIDSEFGIGYLTKQKVQLITAAHTQEYMSKVINSLGKQLILIDGKAGSGKTTILLNIANHLLQQNKHVRIITYNKLLELDIKNSMRQIPNIRPQNLNISTMHAFFHELYKNNYDAKKRTEEMEQSLKKLVSNVNMIVKHFSPTQVSEFSNADHRHKFILDHGIPSLQVEACEQYLRFLAKNSHKNEPINSNLQVLSKDYIQAILNSWKEQGSDYIADYTGFLEATYTSITSMKYNAGKEDVATQNQTDRVGEVDGKFKGFQSIDGNMINNVEKWQNKIKWSKYIIIDEAQDSYRVEKEILMEIGGPERLIVASGGKEQLIKRPFVTDWGRYRNMPINKQTVTLPTRSCRQMGNIIQFINAFSDKMGCPLNLKSLQKYEGKGRVIIDISHSLGINTQIIEELTMEGKARDCTNYESLMVLLPNSGTYTQGASKEKITADENGNLLKRRNSSSYLKTEYFPNALKEAVWDGTNDGNKKSNFIEASKTRYIYYESCRGLEAWNVICVELDSYYLNKKNSIDAIKFASENFDNNLFETDVEKQLEVLKVKHAVTCCNMALTRGIYSLYISLGNLRNKLSQTILECAKELDFVEIIK